MVTIDEAQGQLNYEVAVYREQLSMLKRETERISLTTIDLANALKTIEGLGTEKVLLPVGGGAMIKGTITETKVLVPVGAEYLVEMDKNSAVGEIKRRIDATNRAVEKLSEEFTKIMNKLQDVSKQLEQMQVQSSISRQTDENIKEDYV